MGTGGHKLQYSDWGQHGGGEQIMGQGDVNRDTYISGQADIGYYT